MVRENGGPLNHFVLDVIDMPGGDFIYPVLVALKLSGMDLRGFNRGGEQRHGRALLELEVITLPLLVLNQIDEIRLGLGVVTEYFMGDELCVKVGTRECRLVLAVGHHRVVNLLILGLKLLEILVRQDEGDAKASQRGEHRVDVGRQEVLEFVDDDKDWPAAPSMKGRPFDLVDDGDSNEGKGLIVDGAMGKLGKDDMVLVHDGLPIEGGLELPEHPAQEGRETEEFKAILHHLHDLILSVWAEGLKRPPLIQDVWIVHVREVSSPKAGVRDEGKYLGNGLSSQNQWDEDGPAPFLKPAPRLLLLVHLLDCLNDEVRLGYCVCMSHAFEHVDSGHGAILGIDKMHAGHGDLHERAEAKEVLVSLPFAV